ncbi:MAG: ATP synthase F1 subunit epsilon [Acidimicrobiia bacterium]
MALEVQLVSPERVLFSGTASMVVCRVVGGGDIAFLTGHAPFIGALDIWPVKIVSESAEPVMVAAHGGFVEVSNDRVALLSDVAELAETIDVDRARRAHEAAEARLRAAPDDEDAEAALRRARVRIEVATGAVVPAAGGH